MLWVLLGIVAVAFLSLIFAAQAKVDKMQDKATKLPDAGDKRSVIRKTKLDGLQDIKDHEDHLT